jgi:hypothetical protein
MPIGRAAAGQGVLPIEPLVGPVMTGTRRRVLRAAVVSGEDLGDAR